MITKPEQITNRILKAIGRGQSVLLVGDWGNDFTNKIRSNENGLTKIESTNENLPFLDNSFTRIIADYNNINSERFYNEARRLLLPTGMIIISANSRISFFEKILNKLNKKKEEKNLAILKIKPKVLQDQIHDNGFLIDGYYGYPNGHLIMMAQIQNKEVTTLFKANKQKTVTNNKSIS